MRAQVGDELSVLVVPEGLNGANDCCGVNVVAFGEFAGRKEESVFGVFENRPEQLSPARIEFSLRRGDALFQRSRALPEVAGGRASVRKPNFARLSQVSTPK